MPHLVGASVPQPDIPAGDSQRRGSGIASEIMDCARELARLDDLLGVDIPDQRRAGPVAVGFEPQCYEAVVYPIDADAAPSLCLRKRGKLLACFGIPEAHDPPL